MSSDPGPSFIKIRLVLCAAILVCTIGLTAQAQTPPQRPMPADFKSDACTLFPDGNYCECGVDHDKDYYFGGTVKERWRSDKRLYKCVRSHKGWKNKVIAPVMWVGVRIGGVSFLPTPFRWGFGKTKKPKVVPPAVRVSPMSN
ncbi:MAG TPA: hypothetical protein VK918_03005 [Pyrinomonadaceae bacterium]|nr:hypothetical protein [Pyrinomonadaceae bacterium]